MKTCGRRCRPPAFPDSGASMARACLLLLVCVCAHAHMHAKEYLCQDPDTGTLHGINTTWRSTTFCGNYTCKIRTKNTTQAKANVNLFDPQIGTAQLKDKINITNELILNKIIPVSDVDNDRLLNNAEIHKITELLHTVKKSDLQAVIELYNVAQELYKDMKVNEDSSRTSDTKLQDPTEAYENKISYWYEPLDGHRKVVDMKTEASAYKDTTVYPYRRPYLQPYVYSQSNSKYPSYFTGTLLGNGDFGRLGYYNPQASQQNLPPYPQQRPVYDVAGTTSQSSCNPCRLAYPYQTPLPAYPQRPSNMHRPPLPYPPPFYNYTQSYNNYYKGNPWAYYDYYKNYPYQAAPQTQRNQVGLYAEAVVEKTGASEENKAKTENKDESWKTDPLSEEVIKEIRANIAQRGKLLSMPLKKRIKLERAAKVIKLDQFNRKTRSIPDEAQSVEKKLTQSETSQERNNEERRNFENKMFEVYVERVTCEPTSELGYFKMGNLTKPFPDCCPQKIDKL